MVFYFDVDGTLTPSPDMDDMRWRDGCVDGIKALLRAGHEVYVWTARGAPEYGGTDNPRFKEAADFIHATFPKIPVLPKPNFTYCVDDRAIGVHRAPNGINVAWVFKTYGIGI